MCLVHCLGISLYCGYQVLNIRNSTLGAAGFCHKLSWNFKLLASKTRFVNRGLKKA